MEFGTLVNNLPEQGKHVHRMEFDIVTGDFAVSENVLNQTVQSSRGGNALLEEIAFLFGEACPGLVQDNLQEAVDGAKRRAHIVRQTVRESFELANGRAQVSGAFRHDLFELFLGADRIGDVTRDL